MDHSSKRRKLEHGEQVYDDGPVPLPSPSNPGNHPEESESAGELEEEGSEDATEDEDDGFSDPLDYISSSDDSAKETSAHDRYLQRRQARREARNEQAKAQTYNKEQELKVQKAYSDLEAALTKDPKSKSKTIPTGPVTGGRWNLYSAAYINHYHASMDISTKSISFYEDYDEDDEDVPIICKPGEITAELHIYANGHFDCHPFKLPKHASLDPTRIQTLQGHDMQVVFLGNGFLKLSVELDVLLKAKSTGSRRIEFSGIFHK